MNKPNKWKLKVIVLCFLNVLEETEAFNKMFGNGQNLFFFCCCCCCCACSWKRFILKREREREREREKKKKKSHGFDKKGENNRNTENRETRRRLSFKGFFFLFFFYSVVLFCSVSFWTIDSLTWWNPFFSFLPPSLHASQWLERPIPLAINARWTNPLTSMVSWNLQCMTQQHLQMAMNRLETMSFCLWFCLKRRCWQCVSSSMHFWPVLYW